MLCVHTYYNCVQPEHGYKSAPGYVSRVDKGAQAPADTNMLQRHCRTQQHHNCKPEVETACACVQSLHASPDVRMQRSSPRGTCSPVENAAAHDHAARGATEGSCGPRQRSPMPASAMNSMYEYKLPAGLGLGSTSSTEATGVTTPWQRTGQKSPNQMALASATTSANASEVFPSAGASRHRSEAPGGSGEPVDACASKVMASMHMEAQAGAMITACII